VISTAYARWTPDPVDRQRVASQIVEHAGDGLRFWVEDGAVHTGLPWWEFERATLLEAGLPSEQPAYSRSVIPYTAIPFTLRARLNRVRIAALRRRAEDSGFPADPVETGLDRFREALWRQAAELAGVEVSTPASPRTLILTHDVDEEYGWPGIETLRRVERDLGVSSAFGVLSQRYTASEKDLQSLIDEGCEVFSHGYLHDGTLAFLPADELRRRLSHFFEVYPSMRGHVRGFRAGQLVRSRAMFEVVAEVFDYDLTPPNVELGGPHGWRTGCATTIPFVDEHGLTHLPLTLPQDYFLAFIDRLGPDQIAQRWLEAAQQVWDVGGIAVHLIHPDNVRRRPALVRAYRTFLERALASGAQVQLPREAMAG
jgi:peptidoglycan/xylan/chitin deacetylase (PgdA/CDA1 family)